MEQELYNMGLEKMAQGDLAGAIKEFNRAIKLNPGFVDAYYKRAIARYDCGDLPGTIEDYTQVLQLDCSQINAYCGRGLARLAIGNFQEAIADATESLRINYNHAPAYSLRGTACQRLGHTQAAIANFKKAAEIYLELKEVDKCRRCIEAIKKLQSPLKIDDDSNTDEFINEALKKAMSGKYGQALEDFNWVLQLNPQDERAYYHRGLIYARWENHWEAIEEFERVLKLKPTHAEAYYHRGMSRAALQDYAGAIADLTQSGDLFITQGNLTNYQQAIADIKKVETWKKEHSRRRYQQQYQEIPRGKASFRLQQRLMILVGGNWDTAWRLVEKEREKNPGMPEDWYWGKVIYQIERDRGIK